MARAVMAGKMSYDGKMMRPKFKYDDIPSHYATDRNKKGLRKGFYEGISLMKLGWVLGHTQDHDAVGRMMRTPINHEITRREPHDGYLILQGGLPETRDWIEGHWK